MNKQSELKTPVITEMLTSFAIQSVASESLTFLTQAGAADAGEAAGVIVLGKLAKAPVLNLMGDRLGEFTGSAFSTSISFTTGVLDSTKEVGFIYDGVGNERITKTIAFLAQSTVANGSWACDYLTGLIIVKKKTSDTSQTISYKVRAGGGGGTSSDQIQGNVAAGATDAGNPVKTGGVYNSSAPTLTNGQRGDTQLDSKGNTQVNLYTKIAGENLTYDRMITGKQALFANINTIATTTVKSGAGELQGITINTPVANAVITIYNNTAGSGAKIGTITLPAALLSSGPIHVPYGVAFSTGLTLVTSTTMDITVSYF